MRGKLAAGAVAAALLAYAGVAIAHQTQVNGYEVYGDVHPNKVGTKKQPLPVGLEVGYRATEASGLRHMAIKCRVPVKVYNSGKAKAAIYLVTQQPACAVAINQAIDARYVDAFGTKGRAMQFEVPGNLLHPIPGLSIAVMRLDVELPRRTVKVKGRTRGYFESTVPCFKGDRWGQLDFVTESGETGSARYVKPC